MDNRNKKCKLKYELNFSVLKFKIQIKVVDSTFLIDSVFSYVSFILSIVEYKASKYYFYDI